MQLTDLTEDERQFLVEATDFEQSFWDLITFVHDHHPEMSIAQKYALAQSIAEGLVAKGVMQVQVIHYVETKTNCFEPRASEVVSLPAIQKAWSNPHFWSRVDASAGLLGIASEGHSAVALTPTALGESLLDQIFSESKS